MRLILDTHFVIAILNQSIEQQYPQFSQVLYREDVQGLVSVASLWEIAIKMRFGKLAIHSTLDDASQILVAHGFSLLSIEVMHVIRPISPELDHRDPFDRLLLGQCAATNSLLLTIDRMLVQHPLSAKLNIHQ